MNIALAIEDIRSLGYVTHNGYSQIVYYIPVRYRCRFWASMRRVVGAEDEVPIPLLIVECRRRIQKREMSITNFLQEIEQYRYIDLIPLVFVQDALFLEEYVNDRTL